MANTPGGGALILGVSDDGRVIGTNLDTHWLQQRIYDLTNRMLTVDIREANVNDKRLLVITSPSAIEPIRVDGKINWRVGDRCVEIDAATWHARRLRELRYDWSGDTSTVPVSAARPQAIAIAREFLLASGDPRSEDLANSSDRQLLRRLNAATDGHLTNAGVIAFVGRDTPALDYVHREVSGGDSTARVYKKGRSLLEELSEVFSQVDLHNPTRHMQSGLVVKQVKAIPSLAAREAIVNGVAHREWGLNTPTTVEHVGNILRVTSPGGFFGGVTEENIITHPSDSRNAALTQLLSDLRIAEREGVGVDRMVREMIRVGNEPPSIREISGPYVRATLFGDEIDSAWISWLGTIKPLSEASDVSSLLILYHLTRNGWIDEQITAQLIQLDIYEARAALLKLSKATIDDQPIIETITGVPESTAQVWRLSNAASKTLAEMDHLSGNKRASPTRREIAISYASKRRRISSTEFGALVGSSPSNVNNLLKSLVSEGLLEPSTLTGRGRGFYYRWVGDPTDGVPGGAAAS